MGTKEQSQSDLTFLFLLSCCITLVAAGILSSGAILALFSFPLAAGSLVFLVRLGLRFGKDAPIAAKALYWIGVPLLIAGSFQFGAIVRNIHMRENHYLAERYLPPNPDVLLELATWLIPSVLIVVAMKWSRSFVAGSIMIAAVLPLSINPLIVWLGLRARLGLSL